MTTDEMLELAQRRAKQTKSEKRKAAEHIATLRHGPIITAKEISEQKGISRQTVHQQMKKRGYAGIKVATVKGKGGSKENAWSLIEANKVFGELRASTEE